MEFLWRSHDPIRGMGVGATSCIRILALHVSLFAMFVDCVDDLHLHVKMPFGNSLETQMGCRGFQLKVKRVE